MMYNVRFLPSDKTISVASGTNLTVAALEAGILLRNDCGNAGMCGKCKVHIDGHSVLACRVQVLSDLVVSVPNASTRSLESDVIVQDCSFITNRLPQPAASANAWGACFDIGTTTLAMQLFDLNDPARLLGVVSRANPQRVFGDDLISRIQKIMEEPSLLPILQQKLIHAADEMLAELFKKGGGVEKNFSRLVVAGNTVMEHLFLGIDPSPLGFAPFVPPVNTYPECQGSEIGLTIIPDGTIETLPIFGGFVGGDLVAGVLATGIYEENEPCFLIDIGTNGELVLVHEGKLYTAAAAAGPAFEGARIEYGILAVPGAIDRVTLQPDGTVSISTIQSRPAMGICGSGLIDVVSELLRNGLVKPNGQFHVKADSPFLKHWKMVDGKPNFVLVTAEESGRNEPILLTQRDIRQLQLAVGAIRAGIKLLLRHVDLEPREIRKFYVAGGFGSYIRPESARQIGLLPREIPLDRFFFCGNTSLAGACRQLLDPSSREICDKIVGASQHLDLASFPHFAEIFAECMIFDLER